jgi:hypothetical protein
LNDVWFGVDLRVDTIETRVLKKTDYKIC